MFSPPITPRPPFSLSLYKHKASDYTTSHFVHPLILLLYRFVCLIYVGFFNVLFVVRDGASELRYFTILNYLLLFFYLIGMSAISLLHFFVWKRSESKLPTVFHMLMWVMGEVAFANALFLDIVYWALLWEKEDNIVLDSLHSHALNFFVILGEMWLNKLTFLHSHLMLVIEFSLGYLVFAWTWHYTGGEWIYDFLDTHKLIALGYYPAFILGMLLYGLKHQLSSSICRAFYFWKLQTVLRDKVADRFYSPRQSGALVMDRRDFSTPSP